MRIAAMPVELHPSSGRVTEVGVNSTDRYFAVAVHLSPLANFIGLFPLAFFGPLVLWLIRKDESAFVEDHGREMLNFMLSFCVWHVILVLTVIGALLVPVLWIVTLVSVVRAAVAAGRGEYFRYPVTFRWL